MAKLLELRPAVTVAYQSATDRNWPVHSRGCYFQSRPPGVDTIDWGWRLTSNERAEVYLCAGGNWTQLSIGLLNHGKRGHTPAYLWVIGMDVCGNKDVAALATMGVQNPQVFCALVLH